MNPITSLLQRAPGGLRAALLLALLGGCGGGVDSGGTGGATVYASGPINGYGSIIVNGVRFDDKTPGIDIRDDDGNARGANDLKLGMVVEVRGSTIVPDISGDLSSVASSITLGSEILGPVEAGSISLATNSFAVLGRPVYVQPTTVFADVNGLIDLASGMVVEVYGLYNAQTDRFTATRIERKSSVPTNFRIRGKVSSFRANPKTFSIGTLQVDYATIVSSTLPAGLDNGSLVRVLLDATSGVGVGDIWVATRIRDGVSRPDNGQHSKVEGLVSGCLPTGFSVGGVSVTRGAGTIVTPTGADVCAAVRVEVEGTFSNGALAATKIEVEDESGDPEFDFRGLLEAVSSTTPPATIKIQGITVGYSGATEFINGGPTNLQVNANVRVRAIVVNGTQLHASRIEFKN